MVILLWLALAALGLICLATLIPERKPKRVLPPRDDWFWDIWS